MYPLAACSKQPTMDGKYVIVDITDDPDGVTFADLDAMYKEIEGNIEEYLYMEFLEDGKFVIVLFGEEEASGTYSLDGNTLSLTVGGDTTSIDVSGKQVTWTYENGAKLIFEKK